MSEPEPTAMPEFPEETKELVRQGIAEAMRPGAKVTLADLFQSVLSPAPPQVPDKRPPVPLPLTEAQREAAARLPDVYGKVIVTADRVLTKAELRAIVEERQVIDTLLGALKQRKDESIREVLANHLDHLYGEEEKQNLRCDAKGHYAPPHGQRQEVSVEGTGLKVQRSTSGGKPTLTIEDIEALYAEGLIDRKTYLAITKKPDPPRVLDETGLHKAIQKDPRLFFLLGFRAKPTNPITTIKVVTDQ